MNSGAFDLVESALVELPALDAVAVCRAASRGHAAHATVLRTAPKISDSAVRKLKRAEDAERFWAASALRLAVLDLIEEHADALPPAIVGNLLRFADRQARDIADPLPGGVYSSMRLAVLMPPPEHLPKAVPAALVQLFGSDLGLSAEAAQNKSGTCFIPGSAFAPVRQRTRPNEQRP